MKLTWPVACTTNRCPWVRESPVRVHAMVPGTSTTVGDDSAGTEADAEAEAGTEAEAVAGAGAPGRWRVRHAVWAGAAGPLSSIGTPSQSRCCSPSTAVTNR